MTETEFRTNVLQAARRVRSRVGAPADPHVAAFLREVGFSEAEINGTARRTVNVTVQVPVSYEGVGTPTAPLFNFEDRQNVQAALNRASWGPGVNNATVDLGRVTLVVDSDEPF